MSLFPMGTSSRDAAFMTAGGIGYWALHKPIKRGKMLYRASNFIRIGTASSSLGLGQITLGAAKFGGAAAAGYAIGAVTGTAISGAIWGKQGARDAIDFYTFNVDPIDYIPHVNAYRILKSVFD